MLKDLTEGRTDVPVRFEILVEIDDVISEYIISFEFSEGELRVLEEKYSYGGRMLYSRKGSVLHFDMFPKEVNGAVMEIDAHLIALPILHSGIKFKEWLSRMLVLRPIPSLIAGESNRESASAQPGSY